MQKHLITSFFLFILGSSILCGQINTIDPVLLKMYDQQDLTIECLISIESTLKISTSDEMTKNQKAKKVYTDLRANATMSQIEIIGFLSYHNIKYKSFLISNVILAELSLDQLQLISTFNGIKRIMSNPNVKMEDVARNENIENREVEAEWGIRMIRADSVWQMGIDGTGVIVAGQDTGYDWDNNVLIKKYAGYNESDETTDHNYAWHDAIREINPLHGDSTLLEELNPCGFDSGVPCDDNGHGTHTMGTMIGSDSLNNIGVAPGAKWIACRNMERGYGSPATYLECFEWFLAPTDLEGNNPDPLKAPHVINNSWSCPEMEGCTPSNWSILEEAVNNLKSAGVVVVVSAGNSGPDCGTISTPSAIFENSFTIGATNDQDTIANFSSRGLISVDSTFRMKPNVSAPGVSVRSSIRNNQFASFSGTSMAGPHVAGTIALMISANPDLAGKVDLIVDILEGTAVYLESDSECFGNLSSDIPNHVYGYGRIDALKAVERAIGLSSILPLSEENPFKLFPNPAQDILNLNFERLTQGTINIFDITGKLIRTIKLNNDLEISVDISTLSQGTYFIQVGTGGRPFVDKFVKT